MRFGCTSASRLSIRDVEELLAERGIEVSREAVRMWAIKFGPQFARNLRRRQPRPTGRWHIDEMVVKIAGERRWLWRAVDDEGVVLDMLVQRRRNKKAALRLLSKLLEEDGRGARDDHHGQAGVVWCCAPRAEAQRPSPM